MARKTNKTAHVLNLLAAGTADENEQKENDGSALAPNISIEDNPTSSADPLAGLIRNTLNKELLHEDEHNMGNSDTEVSEENSEADDTPEVDDASEPDDTPKTKKKVSPKAASKSAEESKTKEAAEQEEDLALDEPIPAKKKKTTAKSKASKAEIPVLDTTGDEVSLDPNISAAEETSPETPAPEASATEAVAPPASAAKEYVYLNMMDILVDERLMEFLNKFGACTCHRCVLDAKALALSNLPPKYLVIPDSSTAPLTSFYRNKFSIYIVTELTKACLAIINSPRH